MKTLLRALFLEHWQRKAISVGFAVLIWFVVDDSLTATKTLTNIPVKVVNLPAQRTVEGLQNNGFLNRRLTLSVVGNKKTLDELTSTDIEAVIDATDKQDEWFATITKKNLVSLNPELDLAGIARVSHQSFPLRLTKLITEKIPVVITQPIGDPPRGYQLLDIFPYKLNVTVTGPEEAIKKLRLREQRLTFNLNEIKRAELDALQSQGEIVSFFVPEIWKQIRIPMLSETPLDIDDPMARNLRIDFIQYHLIPIEKTIPLSLFVTPGQKVAPTLATHHISGPLYAKGVSRLFVDVVQHHLQIVVVVTPKGTLEWSLQFINPSALEEEYIARLKSDITNDEVYDLQPLREDYWRNRFRSYMQRIQLFHSDETRLDLKCELIDNKVVIRDHT